MASWLDVRARDGRWLVRIEDLDRPRVVFGAREAIVASLAAHGFRWDGAIVAQSERSAFYQAAFERLQVSGAAYPCGCSRRDIDDAGVASTGAVYPGTCRGGIPPGRTARAWRLRVPAGDHVFVDRAHGRCVQDLATAVGDFVIRRADGPWAYQLAVVVDDAAQGVTDVVRGADLLDSTARQRWLQTSLGLPHPRTLHVPLVRDAAGEKLGKRHGAVPLDAAQALATLHVAARHLSLDVAEATSIDAFWESATAAWARRWPLASEDDA